MTPEDKIKQLTEQLAIERKLLDQAVEHIQTQEFEPYGDGNPYYYCPECEISNVQVTSSGHHKGCRNGESEKLRLQIREVQANRQSFDLSIKNGAK